MFQEGACGILGTSRFTSEVCFKAQAGSRPKSVTYMRLWHRHKMVPVRSVFQNCACGNCTILVRLKFMICAYTSNFGCCMSLTWSLFLFFYKQITRLVQKLLMGASSGLVHAQFLGVACHSLGAGKLVTDRQNSPGAGHLQTCCGAEALLHRCRLDVQEGGSCMGQV